MLNSGGQPNVMAVQLTWFDSNSWLIEIGGQRILLDPWLVGSLVFGKADWFFKGERQVGLPVPESVDAILLSQGLEDHAHPPTLEILPKNWPVVGSQKAVQVAQSLDFPEVVPLEREQKFILNERVEIWALPGSPIGPTLVENAYVITDLETGERLYYEPHGFHSAQVKALDNVDIVLTPVIGISILGLLPVLNGQQSTLDLAKAVNPRFIVPTGGAETIDFKGLLTQVLRLEGDFDAFRTQLKSAQLQAAVLEPKVNEPLMLESSELLVNC